MKIVYIVDDYLPTSHKVAAKMAYDLCHNIVHKGHSVTIITPSHDLKQACTVEENDGIEVIRFRAGKTKDVGFVRRAINETLLPVYAWWHLRSMLKQRHYDGIIYYSPTIFWGKFVSVIKGYWCCASFLILRDFFPQWAIDQGLIKQNSVVERYFRFFESANYAAADYIGIQSQSNLSWFCDEYTGNAKLQLLYNWAVNREPLESDNQYRKKLGIESKVVFFYGGNIGSAQDTMNLVRLARRMKQHEEAHFLFVGNGDEVELLLEAKAEYQLENLTYLPPIDQEAFTRLVAEVDIGLFSLSSLHKTHNFPGKLLGYMQQEIPILGGVNAGNDLITVIEEHSAGFVFTNGNDDALYEHAVRLLKDVDLRTKMGSNGKALLQDKFSVDAVCEQVLHVFM